MVKKIIITNKHNTKFVVRNNVFEDLEGVEITPSIKRKALNLIGNTDDPQDYKSKLGKGILYLKWRSE